MSYLILETISKLLLNYWVWLGKKKKSVLLETRIEAFTVKCHGTYGTNELVGGYEMPWCIWKLV